MNELMSQQWSSRRWTVTDMSQTKILEQPGDCTEKSTEPFNHVLESRWHTETCQRVCVCLSCHHPLSVELGWAITSVSYTASLSRNVTAAQGLMFRNVPRCDVVDVWDVDTTEEEEEADTTVCTAHVYDRCVIGPEGRWAPKSWLSHLWDSSRGSKRKRPHLPEILLSWIIWKLQRSR